ncbi:MAG: hypothetical protein HYX65_03575 [Gemmatimonadetes bacterium]|nr:hypothetical protein [Gemmatimonadota bacterium]
MSAPDPDARPAERWPEFMKRWLDTIGTPAMAYMPTPNSVPMVQRIDDIVARATKGVEQHADRVRDAHIRAAAWQAEAARTAELALGSETETIPKRPGPARFEARDAAAPAAPPGRIDRIG